MVLHDHRGLGLQMPLSRGLVVAGLIWGGLVIAALTRRRAVREMRRFSATGPWRYVRWPLAAMAFASFSAYALVPFFWSTTFAGPALGLAFFLGCLMFACWGYVVPWWRRGLLRKVRAKRYRVCVDCMYSLDGTTLPGRCPECGHSYESDESLRLEWHEALGD